MKLKLLYSILLFSVGACQQADVKPTVSAKGDTSVSSDQTATPQEVNCGDSQAVLSYSVRWGFANSNAFFYQPVTYAIQMYGPGRYQPLQMDVRWDYPLCFGPKSADYLDVILHLPDGSTQNMGRFNPRLGDSSTVITIPPVDKSNEAYSKFDDAAPGSYYVDIEYGISGSTYPLAKGYDDTSNKKLNCVSNLE